MRALVAAADDIFVRPLFFVTAVIHQNYSDVIAQSLDDFMSQCRAFALSKYRVDIEFE